MATTAQGLESLLAELSLQSPASAAREHLGVTVIPSALDSLHPPRAVLSRAECSSVLYVDGLNYASKHFFKSPDHWRVEEAARNVARFVSAAERARVGLTVFLDAAAPSDEAQQKWRTRRQAEVRNGKRDVPHGMNALLAEMFRAHGVQVLLSVSHDNDDTLAAYAQADGAAVLSADKDFFRYRGASYQVYDDFRIEGRPERLKLIPAARPPPQKLFAEPRNLPTPLPSASATGPPSLITLLNGDLSGREEALYLRGTPSALTRALGVNLHAAARPLRLALYARLRREGSLKQRLVREVMPVWDAAHEKVAWDEVVLDVDALERQQQDRTRVMDGLLDRPDDAVAALFPAPWPARPQGVHELDYSNHVYAMHAVVFELCCMANPDLSLLQLLTDVAARSYPPREWRARPTEPPAYSFLCDHCYTRVDMAQGEVDFFLEKGFTLPKRCKACRAGRRR